METSAALQAFVDICHILNKKDVVREIFNENNRIKTIDLPNTILHYYSNDVIKVSVFNNDTISGSFNTCYYFENDYCIVSLNKTSGKTTSNYKLYLYKNDSLMSCLVKNKNDHTNYTNITNSKLIARASSSLIANIKKYKRM